LPKPNDEHVCRDHGVLLNGSPPRMVARGHVVDLDVSWLVPPDLNAIDALARLQVVVSRCGGLLRLHGLSGGLAELIDFVGLGDVIHLCCHRSCHAVLVSGAELPKS
jgi:hypothetical protein